MTKFAIKTALAAVLFVPAAEEKGLSTGLICNSAEGITYAAISAYYAHSNNRSRSADIFGQFLKPRFGNGPDVVIAKSYKKLNDEVQGGIQTIGADIKAKGYTFLRTMDELARLDPSNARLVTMVDEDFDMVAAVKQTVARLSRNPAGFFLVVYTDSHMHTARPSIARIIELDNAVRAVADGLKSNMLMMYTADHGYALYVKGESITETLKSSDHKQITGAIATEHQHTAEEVPVLAMGPGSERVKGYMSNTDVFRVVMAAFGWNAETARR